MTVAAELALLFDNVPWTLSNGRPGLALVALSVVEQRLDAVRMVLAGASVTEVAAQVGVSRQSVHTWLGRYLSEGVAGLADRSSRPRSCPHQACERVEQVVVELRREHTRWGAKRIRLELLRGGLPWQPGEQLAKTVFPSTSTINRILRRHGLVKARPRKRSRDSFIRFERPGPMQLWGIDIVGGITLVDSATGQLREAKIVTGVDDHSRFCVMAAVVERATSRAVCVAFAQALARYGVPEEVITDNGTQFTDRFSRYGPTRGKVLFDKICRKNGVRHRLTAPGSPNQNGKVERFHGTLRPEIGEAGPFDSLAAAQVAVDGWVDHYNRDRPHQGLDEHRPVVPADRFAPADDGELPVWLPPSLHVAPSVDSDTTSSSPEPAEPTSDVAANGVRSTGSGEPIELDQVVPASGNTFLRGRQFWLGPARAGQVVRFWIDCDWVHLPIGGQRVKSVRSGLSVNDLDHLAASHGAVPAADAPPLPSRGGPGCRANRTVVEVERNRGARGHRVVGQSDRVGGGDPGRAASRCPYRAGPAVDVL
ncbi:IS481 family transposase [Mycobacteroides abscessus]|uniref:IS481 family transposase n=2 Tax=Mycobacteroides abscessus TaxID=36809 RepID=UPI001A96F37F|nr:IS481 family transposase [Mycobacteroides abscessus]